MNINIDCLKHELNNNNNGNEKSDIEMEAGEGEIKKMCCTHMSTP